MIWISLGIGIWGIGVVALSMVASNNDEGTSLPVQLFIVFWPIAIMCLIIVGTALLIWLVLSDVWTDWKEHNHGGEL